MMIASGYVRCWAVITAHGALVVIMLALLFLGN